MQLECCKVVVCVLLVQTSYNPTSHKATTVQTLTRRAQIVCDSDNTLTDKIKHLNTDFTKNNYNTDFIKCNTYIRPNDSSNNSYTTTATIPYVRGTSETIACTSYHLTLKMASTQVVETWVTNNSRSQDSNHPDDLFQSMYVTPGFRPFSYLLGESAKRRRKVPKKSKNIKQKWLTWLV